MSIVGNTGKNSSTSLNSRVDVERHISKYEDICDKGLHEREISIIISHKAVTFFRQALASQYTISSPITSQPMPADGQ